MFLCLRAKYAFVIILKTVSINSTGDGPPSIHPFWIIRWIILQIEPSYWLLIEASFTIIFILAQEWKKNRFFIEKRHQSYADSDRKTFALSLFGGRSWTSLGHIKTGLTFRKIRQNSDTGQIFPGNLDKNRTRTGLEIYSPLNSDLIQTRDYVVQNQITSWIVFTSTFGTLSR